MMRIFLNCLAASAGGGLTYLRNVVPHLCSRSDVQTMVAASTGLRHEIGELPNLAWADLEPARGAGRRFWQEQTSLPQMIRDWRADVLVSAGNFALRKSPVPQILLSGNSLYTSADFSRDLRSRRDYRLLLDTRIKGAIAKKSIRWADCTVAPSEAFAKDLCHWTGASVVVVHHGFDHQTFWADNTPLPADIQQKLDSAKDALRLLFVSHYNYYRNFETLFRALPFLRKRMGGRRVVLFLTCSLGSRENPGTYCAETAATLVRELGGTDQILELGAVPYRMLHHLYHACDIYVTPAYTETFAHPLVEAMASGLPVVASDLPVHREICDDAALFFPRFSPELLADCVMQVHQSSALREQMSAAGLKKSRQFSWQVHVEHIVRLAGDLAETGHPRSETAGEKLALLSGVHENSLS
jgi:glycosyltransferase involved in cell wall biosynthesis